MPSRRALLGGVLAAGLLLAGLALRRVAGDGGAGTPAARPDAGRPAVAPRTPGPTRAPSSSDSPPPAEAPSLDDMQTPWAKVDLNALRAELPDNLYWKMASPTKDPAVIEARARERERWNVEYGKILSNTATPDEIDTYYAVKAAT
jgi:hypothetical protein